VNQQPNQPHPTASAHLGTLFLMHASGTKVVRQYCPYCQRQTAHGKTTQDTAFVCMECFTTVDQQPQG
jgi:hypothetical protein